MRRHDREATLGLALGDERMEAVGKLLGDEAGRQPSLAPARMLHQRRQEGDVVADAVDHEGVERGRLGVDRRQPVGRVGDELGDHRIVVDRNFAALEDAGVVAHRDAAPRSLPPAGGTSPGARSRAGSCGSGPRRRRGSRPPSPSSFTSACVRRSFSPAALRIISSTRSTPVTSSVTGCSTCRRVFISRK